MASNGRDWLSKGFHERGHGMPGDRFVVSGKQYALRMSLEAARRRVEFYRQRGHQARIIDSADRVVLDFDTPLVEPQKFDRFNYCEHIAFRVEFEGRTLELPILHNKAISRFFLRFGTSSDPTQPFDISISGLSPQECAERFTSNPHWTRYIDQFVVVDPPPVQAVEQTPTVPMPDVRLREGEQLVGVCVRPGCMPRG
jgi:hypothetical protein